MENPPLYKVLTPFYLYAVVALSLKDNKKMSVCVRVCDCSSNLTLVLILTKLHTCTQVIECKISVEFVIGLNCFNQFKCILNI